MRHRTIWFILAAGAALAITWASEAGGAQFAVNPTRQDPYKQFKFRVKWDGQYIPGIRVVSGLTRTTEVINLPSGGPAGAGARGPGKTVYEPIILERGRTHDRAFEDWVIRVPNLGTPMSAGAGGGAGLGVPDYRKDIVIEMYNEAGQLALAWRVRHCWPSQYSAVTRLDAGSAEVAIESLTLEHEGFERDQEVTEPTEPSFSAP